MGPFSFLLPFFAAASLHGGIAADTAAAVRQASLDPSECYRVRDLRLARDEIRMYLNDGYLIFGKPVNGVRVSAVFTAEVENGDAELLLMPPNIGERRSLANFAKSPNLNEHCKEVVFVFSGDTATELIASLKETNARKSAEMGQVLAAKWNSVVESFAGSFEVRLVQDLLSARRAELGFFYAAIGATAVGNLDLIHDPRMLQQISLGQLATRDNRRYFDIWTNFEARAWRMGQRRKPRQEIRVENIKIDATIDTSLALKAVTRLRVTPNVTERVIPLDISQRMKVTSVKVDGVAVEAYSPESMRANLIRSGENNLVLITADQPFAANRTIEIEMAHEGRVIAQAGGENIYFVGSRAAWYPNRIGSFSTHELTFRIPKALDLVSTGDLISTRTEGEWKIIHRKTPHPVRFAGFNLGDYEHSTITRNGIKVDVCANRKVEDALITKPRTIDMSQGQPTFPRRPMRGSQPPDIILPPATPNPLARLERMASEAAAALEELSARFGKPPIQTLTISPIPGRFGQGFPGLVYLSTISYLDPRERPIPNGNDMQQMFFSELLYAHEIAHQWWGNGVTSASYQDEWLMEALANYSALWVLEKRKGIKALDQVLEDYRLRLLRKDSTGNTNESGGPITLGYRLISSLSPDSWVNVTYSKGAWIIHMLRRRMGDEAFQKLLSTLYERYRFQPVSTAEFRDLAVRALPPGFPDPKLESFFDAWVNGTGIPELKLTTKVSGRAPNIVLTGTITQSEVDDEFSIWVPVEIQTARGKPVIKWVATASEPVNFSVKLPALPVKVTLDPGRSTLTR